MESGVYKVQSRLFPDRCYVGSTQDFKHRFGVHKTAHPCNKALAAHIDKYGMDDLEFVILEYHGVEGLSERETYWLRKLNPYFNTRMQDNRRLFGKTVAIKDMELSGVIVVSDEFAEWVCNN